MSISRTLFNFWMETTFAGCSCQKQKCSILLFSLLRSKFCQSFLLSILKIAASFQWPVTQKTVHHCIVFCIILLYLLSGYDGYVEVMRPSPALPQGSTGIVNQSSMQPDRLIQSDLDGSLALLAGNLSIRPDGQMKKYAFCNICICVNKHLLYVSCLYCDEDVWKLFLVGNT